MSRTKTHTAVVKRCSGTGLYVADVPGFHGAHCGLNVGQIPILKPRKVVAVLEGLGFYEARQRGSHKQFRQADGGITTVPIHGGRDISPILLRRIAKGIGLTAAQFTGR
jgi:predicted RNA binding protein YcfA (HicA-like mRNA interferase family)